MYRAGNSVEQVFGGTVIKQGDRTPLGFNFRTENGELVSLTGATVQVKIASDKGVVLEKQATISDEYTAQFAIGSQDITGAGDMRIEFIVTYPGGTIEKFPSDDWQRIRITPTLEDVEKYGVGYITFEKLTGEFQNQFDEFTGDVDQQIDYQRQRVDNLIQFTPQPSEVIDARFDENGNSFTNLKAHLDDKGNKIGILQKNNISVLQFESLKVSTANGFDWQPAIQKAIDTAYKNNGGTVILPIISGYFGIGSTSIKLRQNVSLIGIGSRNCKLKKLANTTGNVLEFMQENSSYTFNTKYSGFSIEGTGTTKSLTPNLTPDVTNNGFVINPYWGLDGCRFSDILITDCGGYGLSVEPSPVNTIESEKMVLQQAQFDNVTTQYCGDGARIKGFVGNIQWNTCTFDRIERTAFEMKIGDNGNGAQDNTFINCAFQFAQKGFYAGSNFINANFYGCHFEENSLYNVHFNVNANCGEVTFSGAFFARSPIHLYFEKFGGKCSIDSATWKSASTIQSTDRYIKLGSISGLVYLGFNQDLINIIPTMIEDPSIRCRGFTDFGTRFEMDYVRVFKGISSTSVNSKNLCGNVAIASGAVTQTVTFITPENDNTYRIVPSVTWNTTVWITNKTTTGFTLNFGAAPPLAGFSVDWMLLR